VASSEGGDGVAPAARGEAELDGFPGGQRDGLLRCQRAAAHEVVAGLLVDDEHLVLHRCGDPAEGGVCRFLGRLGVVGVEGLLGCVFVRSGLEEVVPGAGGGAGGLVVAGRWLGGRSGGSASVGPLDLLGTARIGRAIGGRLGSGRSGGPRARRAGVARGCSGRPGFAATALAGACGAA